MRFFRVLMGGTCGLLLGAGAAQAGQASASFAVTATVLNSCIASATDLDFGDYAPSAGSATDVDTTLSITCTNGLDYSVALDGGTTTHSVAARAMSDTNSDSLSYQLYTAADYASIWGDGTGGTVSVSKAGTGAPQTLTVYGQIAAAQYVPAGSYSDNIAVTVTY